MTWRRIILSQSSHSSHLLHFIRRSVPPLSSMPNGNKVWVMIAFSSLAWIFSIAATGQCTFMKRVVEYSLKESEAKHPLFHESRGVGFYGWEAASQCYNYAINGKEPTFDSVYSAARAFTGVADSIGGIALIGALFTSCFPANKAIFRVLAVLLLVVSFFEMLSLILFASTLCKDASFFSYALEKDEPVPSTEDDQVTSSCSMGPGSALAATSACFYFIAGIAARLVRPPKDGEMGTIASMDRLDDTLEPEDDTILTPTKASSNGVDRDDDHDDDDDDDDHNRNDDDLDDGDSASGWE